MDGLERIGQTALKVRDDLEPLPQQLAILKRLAYSRRSTFIVPVTRQQAQSEIDRLLREPQQRARRRRKLAAFRKPS